jgi:AraC family transcriptional regulator
VKGRYFGNARETVESDGLSVWLMAYEPLQTQPWHSHETPGLCALVSGRHRDSYRLGNVDHPSQGLLFRPAGEGHASRIGPDTVLLLNLEFTLDWADAQGAPRSALRSYSVWDSALARWTVVRLLSAINRISPDRTEIANLAVELLSGEALDKEDAWPRWLGRAEELIRGSYKQEIGLDQVSSAVGVSPVHLARVYRAKTGRSITQKLRELRLTEASRLLLQGASAAEAAVRSGFKDQAYLTRCFRQELGTTPTGLKGRYRVSANV